jgi:spore coat protein U-like protein
MHIASRLLLLTATLVAFLKPGLAAAGGAPDARLRLEVDNVEWRGGLPGGYDVFEAAEFPQTVHFKVRHQGEACSYFVVFSTGMGKGASRAASGADTLDYHIVASPSRRVILGDPTQAGGQECLSGFFPAGGSEQELSYTIVVPARQLKPAGRYADLIRIALHQGTPGNSVQHDVRVITFSVRIDAIAALSLVPPGSGFTPNAQLSRLDFGSLSQNKTRRMDLRVRSNAGYHVTFESENGGVMRHLDPSVATIVPYRLQVGGQIINLASGRQTPVSLPKRLTGLEGDGHELQVIIGETGNALAGNYRDNITVTVASDD